MTEIPIPVSSQRMGRPPLNMRATQVRLSEKARQRIEALVGRSKMADFIREAVENELNHREGLKKQKRKAEGD